jgi:hypothetical protein
MKVRIPQGMGGGNMQSMLKQAQKMQEDMADKQAELDAAGLCHFIFADESAEAVRRIISAYRVGMSADACGITAFKRL